MPNNLENLIAAMAEQNKTLQAELQEQSKRSQAQVADLVATIQQMPGVAGPINVAVQQTAPDGAAVRADKVQRIAIGIRKSNRIKDFKHHKDSNVRMYIKKFDEEIKSLKNNGRYRQ